MMTSCFTLFEQAKTRLNTPEIKSKLKYLFGVLRMN